MLPSREKFESHIEPSPSEPLISQAVWAIIWDRMNEKVENVTISYPKTMQAWTDASILLLGVPSRQKVSILVNGKRVGVNTLGSTHSVSLANFLQGTHTFTILFDQKEVKTFSVTIREKSWGNETLFPWDVWETKTLWETPSGRLNQAFIDWLIAQASKQWM